jgi:hypothetical protein
MWIHASLWTERPMTSTQPLPLVVTLTDVDGRHETITLHLEDSMKPASGQQPKVTNTTHQQTVSHVKSRQNQGGAK